MNPNHRRIAYPYDIDAHFLKPLCKLSALARPEESVHPVPDETISPLKKDIFLYKGTLQIPAGSSNYRIR
jgi:hypothetical protein